MSTEPQVGTPTPAPAADTSTDPNATPTPQAPEPNETPDELRARIVEEQRQRKEANAEAQTLRQRLRALEAADAERAKATMTDAEKTASELENLRAQVAKHETERRALTLRLEVGRIGQALGVVDIDAAEKLLPTLTYDDAGNPQGVDAALRKLVKDRPWLLGGSSNTNPAKSGQASETDRERAAKALLDTKPRRSIFG